MGRDYDPLACIPSPGIVRKKLLDAQRKADRLRTLLRVSEELYEGEPGNDQANEPLRHESGQDASIKSEPDG